MTSLVLLLMFSMMAPIELGFEIDLGTEYPAAWIFYEVLTVWFIIDMYFCFRTAYASAKGNMVTDPYKIAIYYMRTWFILDLIATFPFHWILPFFMPPDRSPQNTENLKFIRFTRFSRFMRMLKLLRMVRLLTIVSTYEDELSDEAEAAMHITQRALFVFVVIGHWLACLWVMVARYTESQAVGNWLVSITEETGLALSIHEDPWRIYCFALKFSIGEITTLASNVAEHAKTNGEILFNCLTNILGAILFIQFTGTFIDALVKISSKKTIPRGKVKMVMRYLRKRKTPKHLCLRVKKYLQYVITELSDRQIDHTILDQVSVSLKAELLSATVGQQLKHFPLFMSTSSRAVEKLSLLSEVVVQTSGDVLESDGQLATGLYVVVQG